MNSATTQKSATKPQRRKARKPEPRQAPDARSKAGKTPAEERAKLAAPPKAPSKNEAVLALLKRPEGATLDQMVEATRWLPHTTRAVLTGFKKKGHTVTSQKVNGIRTYWVDRAEPAAALDTAETPSEA